LVAVLAFVLLSKLSTVESIACTSKLRPTRSLISQRRFIARSWVMFSVVA